LKGPAYGSNGIFVKLGKQRKAKEVSGVSLLIAIVALSTSIKIYRGFLEGIHGTRFGRNTMVQLGTLHAW